MTGTDNDDQDPDDPNAPVTISRKEWETLKGKVQFVKEIKKLVRKEVKKER